MFISWNNNDYKYGIISFLMNDDLEAKTDPCPFKTARNQCLLLREEKGSKIHEQNFPCNYEGNYEECKTYKDYRKSQGE